jgi:hypothetical protein
MGTHEDTVRSLETELGLVEQGFRGLTAEQCPEHPDPRLPLIG